MRILNHTGLTAAAVSGRTGYPGHSITVVAKALFRLAPGELTELLDDDELAYPIGDVPATEDEEGGEIRYASDFVHYKPRTDLILVGSCHPPGSEPVPSCRVTFQVGQIGRSLQVSGDRWWSGGNVGHRMTDPYPFTRMELSWERAYGGPHCPDNPVGRGNGPILLEDGREAWPLPNIEYPEQLVAAPEDRPIPAGFGPVAMDWTPRRERTGTYDQEWLRSRWPWYPADLDWGFFNASTRDLQPEGYLQGDEDLFLENLHPDEPTFRTRLPGIRVRCFANRLPEAFDSPPRTERERQDWSPPPDEAMDFVEIPLGLDTLWVDADAGRVALVWRGHADVRDENFSGVMDLFLMTEELSEAPAALEECRQAFRALADLEDGIDDEEPAEPAQGEPAASSPEAEDEEEEEEIDLGLAHDPEEQLRKDMERLGIDLDDPPEVTDEDLARSREFFREQGMDDVVALLDELDEPEDAPEEKEPEAPWTRERVLAAYEADETLAGTDLRGLDLSGLALDGADLAGARLAGADLSGTSLVESMLADADLSRARLTSADLSVADLTGSLLEEAKLQKARLDDTVFESARLNHADLTEARGTGATFVGADLSDAVLLGADFSEGDFTGAILDRVDARNATFASAEFDRVRAVEAMFASADLGELRAAGALDLSGANFTQVEAPGSVWSGATLEGAVLAWARLEGADFSDANLRGADFYAAHLREARFDRANLLDARLATADAFEASFAGAELARADLRGGNFYAAEFLDARFWNTETEGANLRMTKYG